MILKDALDFVSGIVSMLANFISGYNIKIVFTYGGGTVFYFRIMNDGAMPVHRTRIRVYEDDELVYENTTKIDVGKSQNTSFIHTSMDGNEHYCVVEAYVPGSFRVNRNRILGIRYKWVNDILLVEYEPYKKHSVSTFYVLDKDGTLHRGLGDVKF